MALIGHDLKNKIRYIHTWCGLSSMMHLHFLLVEARERATAFAFYTWFKQSMPSSHSLMNLAINL